MRAIAHRMAVKMKPLMTVPQSESNGFFTCSLLECVRSEEGVARSKGVSSYVAREVGGSIDRGFCELV